MSSASKKLDDGEGDAFFKLGEHQFLAMFERKGMKPDAGNHHFGIMVRDDAQIAEVRDKLTKKYGLKLIEGFRCDFRDPWGNRIQVVDLHDESLIWLLPYREVQKAGHRFSLERILHGCDGPSRAEGPKTSSPGQSEERAAPGLPRPNRHSPQRGTTTDLSTRFDAANVQNTLQGVS